MEGDERVFVCVCAEVDVGEDLSSLVDMVKRRAQVASSAYTRRKAFKKSMTHPHSRSYGNLIELAEGEEDDMLRRDRLKFPSDCTIDSAYYELLDKKGDVVHALRELIKAGKEVGGAKKGGMVRHEESMEEKGELESSLSEPDLHRGE